MDVTDAAVRGTVDAIKPGWSVASVERCPHGTDFVAVLDVRTPDGARTAVLKATTADLVAPVVARSEPRLFELVDYLVVHGAESVADLEDDDVTISLSHTHLPKLTALGLVEYDRRSETVRYRSDGAVVAYLENAANENREGP